MVAECRKYDDRSVLALFRPYKLYQFETAPVGQVYVNNQQIIIILLQHLNPLIAVFCHIGIKSFPLQND